MRPSGAPAESTAAAQQERPPTAPESLQYDAQTPCTGRRRISTLPAYAPEVFTSASASSFAGTAYYPGSAGSYPIYLDQNNTIVSEPLPTGKTSFVTIYQ